MRSRQEGVGRKAKEEACLLSLLTSFVFVRLRSSSFVFVRLRSSSFVFVRLVLFSPVHIVSPIRLVMPSRMGVSLSACFFVSAPGASRSSSRPFVSSRGVSCSPVAICLWPYSLVPFARAVFFSGGVLPSCPSCHCLVLIAACPPPIASCYRLRPTHCVRLPTASRLCVFSSFHPPCVSHRRSPNCPI